VGGRGSGTAENRTINALNASTAVLLFSFPSGRTGRGARHPLVPPETKGWGFVRPVDPPSTPSARSLSRRFRSRGPATQDGSHDPSTLALSTLTSYSRFSSVAFPRPQDPADSLLHRGSPVAPQKPRPSRRPLAPLNANSCHPTRRFRPRPSTDASPHRVCLSGGFRRVVGLATRHARGLCGVTPPVFHRRCV
jgi:hypothetical protein